MSDNHRLTRLVRGVLLAAIATGTLLTSNTQAAPPFPTVPGMPYQKTGAIDYINNSRNIVVIDDREYQLAPNAAVHSGDTRLSRSVLGKGTQVGFNPATGAGKPVITELWLLRGK